MKGRLLVFLLGYFLLPMPAAEAQAAGNCKCGAKKPLEAEFDKASVVLVGRIAEQRENPLKPDYIESKVTVFKKFKGFEDLPKTEYLTLYTSKDPSACGYDFQNGFEYLIFATGFPAFFTVDSCGRTEVLDKAMLEQERLVRLIEKRAAQAATARPK